MYKLYCRIYQGVFKIGMNFIPWGMPKTLEGPGSVKKLPKWIKKKKIKNVLVIGGSRTSYYLVRHLLQVGIKVCLVESDPERAAELLLCDLEKLV